MTIAARRGVAGVIFFILASGTLAFAQSSDGPGEDFPAPPTALAPAGTVSCFDYYKFGSVQANITAQTSSAVSGAPVTFSGSIVNSNAYPIVDGSLYIKVFRLRDNAAEKNVNGPYVVDQFLVRDNIDLPAGGEMPIVFSWDVPSYAKSGEYQVSTFFTASKKFNLLGLSFTDDVVGNSARFTVVGEMPSLVEFDKDAVRVDGQPYRFAAFPPRTAKDAPVTIAAKVTNATGAAVNVPVRWQAYSWDGMRRENLVEESSQTVSVPALGSADAYFEVSDARFPVYLVVGTLGWQNTHSVVNVRFVRQGIDRTRINFPGVTAFPIKKGEEVALFSCLHNSGESPVVPNGRLELTLSDMSGRVIHGYVYEGDVTGAMMGVAEKFVPRTGYNAFKLDAMLYQGSTLVDEAHLSYDCSSIDPESCLPESETISGFFSLPQLASAQTLVIGALLVLIIAGFIYLRRRAHAMLEESSESQYSA